MRELTIRVHEVATDGLPDMSRLIGRVAFIFDGCIVSGWPVPTPSHDGYAWEADRDVGTHRLLADITHWIEFPEPFRSVQEK